MSLFAYASDLHGNLTFYADFLHLARRRQAQAAIIGGDILPHTSSRAEAIARQRRFISEQLRPLLAYHHEQGGPPVYLIPGNDDWQAAVQELHALEEQGLLFEIHLRALPLADYFIAGYACVPLTPFSIKDWERPEETQEYSYSFDHALRSQDGVISNFSAAEFQAQPAIAQELAQLAQQSRPGSTIYVCHTPPYDTGIDRTRAGRSVGSHDLRRFIEQHQPPIALHGHIHEAPEMCGRYAVQLGRTWCINAGQGGRLHAVLFDPDDLPGSLWHTQLGAYQP